MLGINTSFTLPDGREVTIETGKLAKQADGSAVVRMGNTMRVCSGQHHAISGSECQSDWGRTASVASAFSGIAVGGG